MKPEDAAGHSLEYLVEPAFLIRRHGEVLGVNAAARRLLGPGIEGGSLFDRLRSPRSGFDAYLRRSSGSTAPLVGAATLATQDGPMRFRLHCAALPEGAGERRLVLRCLSARNDQFSILGRRVRELDAQLRHRLRENAVLEEALQQNKDLLRELQHRVKNNIQMMASLIHLSAQGEQSEEVRALVDRARLRLQAMASAQDAIYRAKQAGLVAAAPLLSDLVQSIGESFGVADSLRLELGEATLPSDVAHSLALIANELTTNAIKHGLPGGRGVIRVAFGPVGDGFELVVQDGGPGIPDDALARSSGLKLVRALCRQIGGTLDIAHDNGTKCTVRFAVDR